MKKLVSIILPSYNSEKYIKYSIESIINQTYNNWELVIVDNNSEDNTLKIINEYIDSRIHCLNIINDGCIAKSRNLGITKSHGDYIAFLDSDDVWCNNKLELCMELLEKNNLNFVAHNLNLIGNKTGLIRSGPLKYASINHLLYKKNCFTPSAVLLAKKIITDVDLFDEREELITAEDYHLWLKLIFRGVKIGILDISLGSYRVHDSNQSGKVRQHMNANIQILNEFHARSNINFSNQILKNMRMSKIHYGACRAYYSKGHINSALKEAKKSILYNPLFLKTYFSIIQILFKSLL